MDRKLIGILLIGLGLIMLIAIVYVLFFSQISLGGFIDRLLNRADNTPELSEPTNSDQIPAANNEINNSNTPQRQVIEQIGLDNPAGQAPPTQDFTKDDLVRMARSFAERFGSYSNQSNFSNVVDLRFFMSNRMQTWADKFVKEKRALGQDTSIYYGITTKAYQDELKEFDEDRGVASVVITTRRREATGATTNYSETFTQDILISFVRESGAWKVDSANWIE